MGVGGREVGEVGGVQAPPCMSAKDRDRAAGIS